VIALCDEVSLLRIFFLPAVTLDGGPKNLLEAISKKGVWLKIAAGPSFKPQEYISISRI
jgi:hypothetical protein